MEPQTVHILHSGDKCYITGNEGLRGVFSDSATMGMCTGSTKPAKPTLMVLWSVAVTS